MRNDAENKLFIRWALWYQNEMTFKEFKNKLMPPKDEPNEIILERVNGYIELFNKGFTKETI